MYSGCPGTEITEEEGAAVEWFRLYHHRSPDVHGVAWAQIATPEQVARLPLRIAAAFSHIDGETHLMAQENSKA